MNAGTILYIPVAQAEGGATVTVKGQLYGPTLKLDGTDITTGTAVTIATDSTRYVPLSVEGTGSLYLTGIAIDYAAGSPAATSHTVTVGPNGQYRTIQAALDANDSSETDRLVLKITPGDYREKITVTKPGRHLRQRRRDRQARGDDSRQLLFVQHIRCRRQVCAAG